MPKPSQPRAPPRPPRPMPSTHTTSASTTTATANPVRQPNQPDTCPPTNPETAAQNAPTNMEILSDPNLFHAHIAEIDNAINNFPLKPQSTVTQEESLKSVAPPESYPSNLRQVVSSDLGEHDTHLVDAPVAHVLDIQSMTGPKRLLDPIQGTWKRLGPSKNKTTDQVAFLQCVGPKQWWLGSSVETRTLLEIHRLLWTP
nr:hypothetical protein CFP56_36886 [Quercus suber]